MIDTTIWDKIVPGDLPQAGQNDPGKSVDPADVATGLVPGGHLGIPNEIANGVLFLASYESVYITRSELVIDHGFTA